MRNKKDTANADVTAKDLRAQLKAIMADELARMPELLEALPPQERIKAVLQLLPYTTPKVETCAADYGEPFSW